MSQGGVCEMGSVKSILMSKEKTIKMQLNDLRNQQKYTYTGPGQTELYALQAQADNRQSFLFISEEYLSDE